MWLLVFICMSTVAGGPIKPTQEAASQAASQAPGNVTVTSGFGVSHTATTESLKVPLNATHDATNATHDATNATHDAPVTYDAPNATHDATNATNDATNATTSPAPVLEPPQNTSAETLEELQEAMIVQEGDILIPMDRNAVANVWMDAIVPYVITNELAYQAANVYAAFKMISDFTCVRFQQHTSEYNYLNFVSGQGCASFVGCRGSAQPVYISPQCSVGNICHELIHALGLHHEHTRKDRDQFISVHWESITPGRQKNFKIKPSNTFNLPYDLSSIMHYGSYYFSQNGSPTMLPKFSAASMGQRTHLSQLDIQKLNTLYHCDERRKAFG